MTQPTAVLLAAFVGIVSALLTAILKDFVFVRLHHRLDKKSGQRDVLRLYVAPLAQASEKLVWRFSEIFLSERHQFLKSATLPLVFNEYKRQSTLYRIASLLGWMRAIQLELNALEVEEAGLSKEVFESLEGVRKALADGPDVERLRLRKLLDVWQLGEPDPINEAKLAAELERRLYAEAGDSLKHDARYLQQADREEKIRVCRSLADFLAEAQKRAKLNRAFLEERIEAAILGMSYREALIYRDWQDAIGDCMLVRDEDSRRKFTIIGYADFVKMLSETSLWMEVFRDSIIDIDFDALDTTDYRATQLSALSKSVSQIVITISETGHKDLIAPGTLVEARKLTSGARC
jgi:hypothetical protein